ncbi:hypothetical protein TIFTF001_003864 [Ficus carica]|uniref:Uncharacterized protein n=1 Tax=Ficus carica TaxID=3494 RepID=A0AA87ZAS8_FICCA|nr:hypothetical protein TIFTF001_003864 [Ficus carica]
MPTTVSNPAPPDPTCNVSVTNTHKIYNQKLDLTNRRTNQLESPDRDKSPLLRTQAGELAIGRWMTREAGELPMWAMGCCCRRQRKGKVARLVVEGAAGEIEPRQRPDPGGSDCSKIRQSIILLVFVDGVHFFFFIESESYLMIWKGIVKCNLHQCGIDLAQNMH